jgi:hypothetical protein
VLSVSKIERHVIMALSWIMRNPIRRFPAGNAARAFDFLDAPLEARIEVMTQARLWTVGLGNPVVLEL